jgi:iron complex outermembrane receptor protein
MSSFKLTALCSALISSGVMAANKPTQKDENEIEKLVITATPFGRTILESATPVSVLAGEELQQNLAPTLGETLKNIPGVNSSYYGPVSSTPIIRGLNGPRIKIVQNGLDSSDASRVGPDHVVSAEASTATQIEVMRGPATLLYGSGAIGGVVNIVDNRLPRETQDGVSGDVMALHNTVSNENTLSGNVDGGSGDIAWHVDGFTRKTDDYDIPGAAVKGSDDNSGTLTNSAVQSQGVTLGGGWITEDARIAFSYGRLENDYGLPAEEDVYGTMEQDRYQAAFDWFNIAGLFQEVHWRNAYTDYQHSEIEDGAVGTTFKNKGLESRLWAKHRPLGGWQGVTGVHFTKSDFSALGEEAFTPASTTETKALFILEEKPVGDLLWQLGGRIEKVDISPDNQFFTALNQQNQTAINFKDASYTPVSVSAGVVWKFTAMQSVAFNLARSERAPSSAEMFSNGPHIGTSTVEIGAGFEVLIDDDSYQIVQSSLKIDKEVSNNLDVTYHSGGDNYTTSVSLFYNQIDNYLYEHNTGLIMANDEGPGLPIYVFRQQNATLYGFEAELDWHFNETLRLDSFADYTQAELDENGAVPRIPPLRLGSALHWEKGDWHGEIGATYYAKQDRITDYETQTDSYTLVSASVNYYLSLDNMDATVYLKGNNLSDQEARVHSSFLKDKAPLPGRSLVLGTRVNF